MGGFLKIQPVQAAGGWGIFFLYAPLLAILYFSPFSWLISVDWQRPEFSYCFFIPFIFLYLIFDKRKIFNSVPAAPTWKGLWLVGASIVLYWLGELDGLVEKNYACHFHSSVCCYYEQFPGIHGGYSLQIFWVSSCGRFLS